MDKEERKNSVVVANKSKSESHLSIDAQHKELRRSSRSPVKPRRYEPEDLNLSARKKNKFKAKSKTIPKCFESETKNNKFVTKSSQRINLIENSTLRRSPIKIKNKQVTNARSAKKVYTGGCVPKKEGDVNLQGEEKAEDGTSCENQSMKKLLFKNSKLRKSSIKETKKNTSRTIKKIIYPTTEELAEYKRREREQIKTNKEMKKIFENLALEPEKVKILSLNNMTSDEILKTFPRYKDQLDIVFHELRSKPKVDDYKGISHYSVIELIDNEKQLKMMNKLGEVYETDPDGISMYPTLFANALMPEWLVHIFKDKYKFSHSEAVSHLNKQRQYMQYMEVDDYH